jgi:NAD-dependent SIR2 family protein deacetylase
MSDRVVYFDDALPGLPEDLLIARDRGLVLFITGAGISRPSPSNLPDFRGLVVEVYKELDAAVADKFQKILREEKQNQQHGKSPQIDWTRYRDGLTADQQAELMRFVDGDYDVVLGMLERRVDSASTQSSSMRERVVEILKQSRSPNALHQSLMRLGQRFQQAFIATTNFDRLLEGASPGESLPAVHVLGSIPRPSRRSSFCGIFHIHGALPDQSEAVKDLVLTDQDFGDVYLRRRIASDFIYDASRIFNLVLVGYSLGDAPMRYLLNAIASDENHFSDIKTRYAFVPVDTVNRHVIEADWRNRGIIPISYDQADQHAALQTLLKKWADCVPVSGDQIATIKHISRLTRTPLTQASKSAQSVFRYLVRRVGHTERQNIALHLTAKKRHFSWLDEINAITRDNIGTGP